MRPKGKIFRKILSGFLCAAVLSGYQPFSFYTAHGQATSLSDNGTGVTLYDRDGDDAYEIGTAEELMAFANLVNNGRKVICGELTADIDLNPGYSFVWDKDTGLVVVKKNGNPEVYIGTGVKGDSSGSSTKYDSSASEARKVYRNVTGAAGSLPSDLKKWTPIGTSSKKYEGVFDGQGHVIRGIFYNGSSGNAGLFGCVDNGIVRNVGVENSYWNGGAATGGIVGVLSNDSTGDERGVVEFCYNTGLVVGTDTGVGGIAGKVSCAKVENCYHTGSVISKASSVGGIVGLLTSGSTSGNDSGKNAATLVNCYSAGEIRGKQRVGNLAGEVVAAEIRNAYYLSGRASDERGTAQKGIGNGVSGRITEDLPGQCVEMTDAAFQSGRVAYLLQKGQGDSSPEGTTSWGQRLAGETVDRFPGFGVSRVYRSGNCADEIYTNTEGDCFHEFDRLPEEANGFCSCGEKEPAVLTTGKYDLDDDGQKDDVYEIGNAGQLYWFAELVNGSGWNPMARAEAHAVLTRDITVNSSVVTEDTSGELAFSEAQKENFRAWEPIGMVKNTDGDTAYEIERVFSGIFDGQGYKISGVYAEEETAESWGLFGQADGEIRNLTVEASYFSGKEMVGAIAGVLQGGTIENCHSADNIVKAKEDAAGGIAGQVLAKTVDCAGSVTTCSNSSTVTGKKSAVGGIVGWQKAWDGSSSIVDCTNRGTITSEYSSGSNYAGGIVGKSEVNNASGDRGSVTIAGGKNYGIVIGNAGTGVSAPMVGGVIGGAEQNYGVIIADGCENYGTVTATSGFGGVVGYNGGATVKNCKNFAQLLSERDRVGGIIGISEKGGLVKNCENHGKITGKSEVGGIIGQCGETEVESGKNTAEIEGKRSLIGGIVGKTTTSGRVFLSDCENTGAITGNTDGTKTSDTDSGVAGIVGAFLSGEEESGVSACRNEGEVNGLCFVGGIGGRIYPNTAGNFVLDRSYNVGRITGTLRVGGLVGSFARGTLNNCYNAGAVLGQTMEEGTESPDEIGGLIGYHDNQNTEVAYGYNIGTVSSQDEGAEFGGLVGKVLSTTASKLPKNCYYLDSCVVDGTNIGTALSLEQMTGDETWEEVYDGFDATTPVWRKQANTMAKLYFPALDAFSPSIETGVEEHRHQWIYVLQEDGRTIAEVCNVENCDLEEGIRRCVTLSVADKVYGERQTSAWLTVSGEEMTEVPVMEYRGRTVAGTEFSSVTDAPEDAGSYTVRIVFGGIAATAEFRIQPRPITVKAQNQQMVYGQEEPGLTYFVEENEGFALRGELQRETGTDAGEYEIGQGTLTNGNNPNFAITFLPGKLTVSKASQEKPPVTAKHETVRGKCDGAILGITADMEISRDGIFYTSVSLEEASLLPAGDYFVRYAETRNYAASLPEQVSIGEGVWLRVFRAESQPEGYRIVFLGEETLEWKGETEFRLEILPGYSAEHARVTASSGDITVNTEGIYLLSNVTEDAVLSVDGVVDVAAPEVTVSVGANRWSRWFNKATFGLFFKENVTVQVEASDLGSNLYRVEYTLRDEAFCEEDAARADTGEWVALELEEGKASFSVPEGKKFVFIRAIDRAGNITVVNTEGGVVVYRDSAASTQPVTFVKTSMEGVRIPVELNGNTVREIRNGTQLIEREAYAVQEDGTIVLSAGYLDGLVQGQYMLRIFYAPQGVAYEENIGPDGTDRNEPPVADAVSLLVQKQTGRVTEIEPFDKVYDGVAVHLPDYSVNSTGRVTIEWYEGEVSSENRMASAPVNAGEYFLRISVEADENYTACEAVIPVKILSRSMSEVIITLERPLIYTGREQQVEFSVRDREGLVPEYTVSGDRATKVGVYTLICRGTGNYTGECEIDYLVQPDASVLTAISQGKVTVAHKEALENLRKALEERNTDRVEQWNLWEEECGALLTQIQAAQNALKTNGIQATQTVTKETVLPEQRESLLKAKAEWEKALLEWKDNYTSAEKEKIRGEIVRLEEALAVLLRVEEANKQILALPETVTPEEETVVEQIEQAKRAYEALTEREKGLLPKESGERLERLLEESVAYAFLSGDESVWTEQAGGLVFRINGSCEKCEKILVDGKQVDPQYYELTSGSTIVWLKEEYLKRLKAGEHMLTVCYENGAVDGTFFVQAKKESSGLPQTGGGFAEGLCGWLLLLSAGGVYLLFRRREQE